VSATPSQGTYNPTSGLWTVGTVAPGPPQTLRIAAGIDSPAVKTNTARISHSDQFDPDLANNSASATVTPAALTLVKTANAKDITAVGQVITYTFHVTNTGHVTLTNLALNEIAFTGTGPTPSCTPQPTSLAPGDSATCTATYTTTEADVARGGIKNVASATGVDPAGGPTTSGESAVTILAAPVAPPSPITPVTVPVTG
jgi:uncharacterized repeat protein (TIGR01451 family)